MNRFITFCFAALAVSVILSTPGCTSKHELMEKELTTFIANYEAKIKPLQKEAYQAYWNASISGADDDWAKSEKLQLALNAVYTSKSDFETLKKIKASGAITDPMQKRELDLIYNQYLANQIDTALLAKRIGMETLIEKQFSSFRAEVNGQQYTDNEIEEILKTSVDQAKLQAAWEAHKKVGSVVAPELKKLIKLRNQIAQTLGFDNYHSMSLKLSEQDPDAISKLFDELDSLTAGNFAELKSEIDNYLSRRYNIPVSALMPWHYQNRFFQEAPAIYQVDLDKYYAGQDIEKLTSDYYKSMGLDIDDILAHSDLYEKPGKNQHAYCIDIDNSGDVRVLCNIKPNYNWMSTMLHEFGHGIYDKYIDRGLPFALRTPSHTFTTEAIAMLFGRMASNPGWMLDMGIIDSAEMQKIDDQSFRVLRLEQLTFSRWAQVMYRFEKSMYENPDQDLDKLWWDLVEKYQLLRRPPERHQPDWASKIHIATVPCYYHNYLLGELLASQLNHYVTASLIKSDDFRHQSFYGNSKVGNFFVSKVFQPGASLYWNDMIEKATGEPLTARYYAAQFIQN